MTCVRLSERRLYCVAVGEKSRTRFGGEGGRWIALGAPLSSGRVSACHLSRPPSSTAALSKPSDRSIHQNRVAHIMVPML